MSLESFPPGAEGKAHFKVGGDEFETWFTVYGNLKSKNTPVVVLNGGPGASHHYMLSCIDLQTKYDIPVIFYDQLGTNNSSKPEWKLRDKPKSFWNIDLFLDELENLVKHLGIEKYDLLGQSWGAIMASYIAAQRQPKGLRKIVLSNGTPSMTLWVEVVGKLIDELPEKYRDAIRKHEADGTYDDPEYKEATGVFMSKHVCRMPEMPDYVLKSLQLLEEDNLVYMTMNGPSEFTVIGTMKNLDFTKDLHKIEVPALLIDGEYDEADGCQWAFFNNIPQVKWVCLMDASHFCHAEQREKYMDNVAGFLTN